MSFSVDEITAKINSSRTISLCWCEDLCFHPVEVIILHLSRGEIKLCTRDIRLALLFDGKRTATIGCKKQGKREGMVIDKYGLRFSLGKSELTQFSREEAVLFVRDCKKYQEKGERWRHDNAHFVYYTTERLHDQGKIDDATFQSFKKETKINLHLDSNGKVKLAMAAGAAIGALVGSVGGPPGALLGFAVGGVAGRIVGSFFG